MKKITPVLLVCGVALVCSLTLFKVRAQSGESLKAATLAKAQRAFTGQDMSEIKAELVNLRRSPELLQSSRELETIMALYKRVSQLNAPPADVKAVRRSIIEILLGTHDHRVFSFLADIVHNERDLQLRKLAKDVYTTLSNAPVNERMDATKFVKVGSQIMTYEAAYPLLVGELKSGSPQQKVKAVNALGLYGRLLKDQPVIDELIELYQATPSPPNKPQLTQQQSVQLELKLLALSAIAVSGDTKRTALLEQASSDSNPIVREWVEKVKKDISSVEEVPPGGLPPQGWGKSQQGKGQIPQ